MTHHYDPLLDEERTACGLEIRRLARATEMTTDPLDVDCRECHLNPEFDTVLARAEYAPNPPGRQSWRQKQAPTPEVPND